MDDDLSREDLLMSIEFLYPGVGRIDRLLRDEAYKIESLVRVHAKGILPVVIACLSELELPLVTRHPRAICMPKKIGFQLSDDFIDRYNLCLNKSYLYYRGINRRTNDYIIEIHPSLT